jgi:hypothetical protein
MALHLLLLAKRIDQLRNGGITLVSLARAGTPVGVLLKHVLKRYFNREAVHYSISILRDRGLDHNALRHILQRHDKESLVFVDGWTGKGVIARQLAASLENFAASDGILIPADLFVLTDLSGFAAVAASSEDYLIPSCILNATVSGLISRTIWPQNTGNHDGFHGCLYYKEFESHDLSNYFIDKIIEQVAAVHCEQDFSEPETPLDRKELQSISLSFLQRSAQRYKLNNYNYIKPGIGEATRVLLRREARLLMVKCTDSEAVRHLLWLAQSKSIPIEERKDLPYCAAALIKEVKPTV